MPFEDLAVLIRHRLEIDKDRASVNKRNRCKLTAINCLFFVPGARVKLVEMRRAARHTGRVFGRALSIRRPAVCYREHIERG